MYGQAGVLIDISSSGALMKLRWPHEPSSLLAFVLQWKDERVLLRGRVVRAITRREVPPEPASIPRIEHHVGVEFVALPPHSVDQLERLIQAA